MAADLINTANARIMLLENHGKLRTMYPYYSYAQLAVSLGTCIPAESCGCHAVASAVAGVITVGESIADAMFRLWYVTKAAEIQVATLQSVRDTSSHMLLLLVVATWR